jgi:hypothetical protein
MLNINLPFIYIYSPRTFNLLTKMAFVQQNLAPTSKSRVPTSESRAHLARTSIPHPPLSTSHRRFHGPRIDFHRRLHHLHPILNHNDFTVPLVSSYSIPTPLPGWSVPIPLQLEPDGVHPSWRVKLDEVACRSFLGVWIEVRHWLQWLASCSF